MLQLSKSRVASVCACVLAGVVAALLIFGAGQAASQHSPSCGHETTHFCYRGHTAEEWIGILTATLAGFTWALAMATAALWLDARSNGAKQLRATAIGLRLAHRQMQSAQRDTVNQLRIAKQSADALVLAQRPWVAVDLGLLKVTRNKDALEWLFAPVCVNVGNTPATNVRVSIGIAPHPIEPWDLEPAITKAMAVAAQHTHKGFALFPSQDNRHEGANHNEVIRQLDVEAVVGAASRYALTVCVLIHYEFPGGSGVTRRLYILAFEGGEYFDVGAVEVDASRVELTRIPLGELAA